MRGNDHRKLRRLASLPWERPAVIGLAETGRLGVVFRAKPAIGARQRRIARASLKMIDADIAGDLGAERVLAFDGTARWHCRVLRKQCFADFAVLVRPAGAAEQGTGFLSGAEFMRGDEATFPQTAAIALGVGLVRAKPAFASGSKVHREAAPNQKLVQTGVFSLRGADAEVPFF